MDFASIDWNDFVEGITIGIITALIAVAGTILGNTLSDRKGYKDVMSKMGGLENTTLSGEHTSFKECSEKQHADLKEHITDKHNQLQKTSDNVLSTVANIDKVLYTEITKADCQYNNLTEKQKDIETMMEELECLQRESLKQMQKLQEQSFEQKLTIEQLTTEVAVLKNQLAQYQQTISPNQIPDMDNNFT